MVVTPRWPPKDGAEGGADAGDLVLGLQRAHAEVLVLRQLVEDVGRRGDRVAAEEDRQLGQLAGGDQAPRQRGVAGDVGVGARLLGGRLHLVGVVEQLGGLAEGVAGPERGQVGVADQRPVGELLGDPVDGRLLGPGVHPRDQPEGEEVLRPVGVAGLDPERARTPPWSARSSAPRRRCSP